MGNRVGRSGVREVFLDLRGKLRARAKAVLTNRTTAHPAVAFILTTVERLERRLLPARVRQRLDRRLALGGRTISARLASPDGHIDGWVNGVVSGWAWIPVQPRHRVTVVVTARGVPVATAMADQERGDVRAGGYGDGRYGYRLVVPMDVLATSVGPDLDHLEVFALDLHGSRVLIGDVPVITSRRLATLLDRLPAEFVARHITPLAVSGVSAPARNSEDILDESPMADAGASPAYRRLLLNGKPSPQVLSTDPFQARPVVSPYMRYAAHRLGADIPIERSAQAADALLRWYLDVYSGLRRPLRPPLSPAEIGYLNAPVNTITAGAARPISRVSLSYFLEDDLSSSISPINDDGYAEFVYWWAVEKAPALHVEDCLVPDYYADVLRAPAAFEPIAGLPVTAFVETYVSRLGGIKGVSIRTPDGILAAYLHLLLRATQRPDLLRYVPEQVIKLFLAVDGDRSCPWDNLVQDLRTRLGAQFRPTGHQLLPDRGPREDWLAALEAAGFDLGKKAFRSVDAGGFRVDAAQLPGPARHLPVVDVQVIGPFAKASGLGQACRLAGKIIQETRYESNLVNFGLDNPGKEGFSSSAGVGGIRNARVNLIHLNAESVPLAFAYLPDVFTESYNIGFFYWELDSPAACHELALELLDEIWVASEYGVSQYRPTSRIPVTNVGMAFEAAPDVDREEARATLAKRFGVRDRTFVFMATFDSYSFPRRKNPVGTIRAFQAAFESAADDVMLILKTQNRRKVVDPVQALEMNTIYEMAATDSRVRIVDETLDYRSLLRLKKGSDAYVSLHRSEGWGFGPLEAMALGVPVICTGYSGNMEYSNEDTAWLVDYELVNVPERDYAFVLPGHRWAEPSLSDAAQKMRGCFEDRARRQARAEAAQDLVVTEFSVAAIARRWEDRLSAILPS